MANQVKQTSDAYAYFDLSDGSLLSNANLIDSSIVALSNGWYRVSITANVSALTQIRLYPSQDSDTSITSGSIYIQDAQLNKGLTTDQYIETTTETSPRADFTFTRNSSATRVGEDGYIQDVQIIGGELVSNGDFEEIGSELITNGSFDTDSDWNLGTGWTISGGKANCDGTQTSTSTLRTNVGISGIQNKSVLISFQVSNYSNGLLNVTLEGTGGIDFENINSNGVYSASVSSADILPKLLFNADANFIGSIDNVSVKEVGQDWVDNDGAVEFSLGQVRINSGVNGTLNRLAQASFTIVGRKYRLSYEVLQNVGTTNFALWNGSTFLNIPNSVGS